MPRKPIDYSKTHFYKLCCKDLEIKAIYVGHTTDFRKRKNQHKRDCEDETRKMHNYPVYQFIRANNGWGNWDMILLETKSCSNALEAKQIERDYIETLSATLNKYIPGRSIAEYYVSNRDRILEQQQEYNKNHKEEKRVYDKGYRQRNSDKIKEQTRLYREQHADHEKDRHKQYYNKNKERINEAIQCCVCSGRYSAWHKNRHVKTKMHQQALEAQSQNHEI